MNACRVVLVRPEIAANIGSAARVMRNLGARELVLVAPAADPAQESARQLATHHGTAILAAARLVPDLETALADCVLVAGTSARTGGLFRRQTVGGPAEVAEVLATAMRGGPVALVFGPESHGLSNEEVQRCSHLIHIPAEEDYSALNLAQAIAICLYEVRKAWLRSRERTSEVTEVAHWEDQARMFQELQKALQAIRYLRGVRGEALMYALRHLIGRAQPSPMEVRLLYGLARQLEWVAERATFEEGSPEEARDPPE